MKKELNKRVLVAGAGKSGIGAAKLLLEHGAEVIVFDQNEKADKLDIFAKIGDYEKLGVVIGKLDEALIQTIDLLVMSPGISLETPFVSDFVKNNTEIWGEIELAYQLGAGHVAAITGTNGKTTTTTLVGEIFKAYRENSFTVGNIGIPYTQVADEMDADSLVAAEVSSFQLETIKDFCPEVSAILNVTPDHLDRHHTMENYTDAKLRVALNQGKDQVCVLNYDDPIAKTLKDRVNARVVFFSRVEALEEGVIVKDGAFTILDRQADGSIKEIRVMNLDEMLLLGDHNVENYLAAIAIAYYMGVPTEVIHKVCAEFKGVAHRIEFVGTVKGVNYYNDSKGTNPDAAIKGIRAMNRPTLLIGGGYDKHVPFDDWILSFDGKVRYLVLIGQTAQEIEDTAKKHGFTDVIRKENLEEAIETCYELANDGDAVLLSPACASWGQFDNYEQRGDMFREYVKKLGER